MKQQIKFIDENFNRFTEELKDLLRIPSVSTDTEYKNDIQKCAKWIKDHLDKIGKLYGFFNNDYVRLKLYRPPNILLFILNMFQILLYQQF